MVINIKAKLALAPDARNTANAMCIVAANFPQVLEQVTSTPHYKTVLPVLKDASGAHVGELTVSLASR